MSEQHKKKTKTVVIVILSILGVFLVAATAAGLLYATSSTKMLTRYIVCDDEIVTRYNEIADRPVMSDEDLHRRGEDMRGIASEISQLDRHEGDPTCAFIQYQATTTDDKMTGAQQYVDRIEQLADEGKYVNTRLSGIMSISQMQDRIDAAANDSDLGSG